jgi:KUP system potassium uptake protein
LLQELESGAVPRVPGSAVFFTRSAQGVPPVLNWHLKHNRALHESLLLIRLSFSLIPRVAREDRLAVTMLAPNFWRADVSYGFMEAVDIPQLLADAKVMGCNINLHDVTYYVGHDTIVSRTDGKGLPTWQTAMFALLFRNAARLSEFLKIPSDQLVEIGRQVPI